MRIAQPHRHGIGRLIAVLAVTALLLAACGEDDDDQDTTSDTTDTTGAPESVPDDESAHVGEPEVEQPTNRNAIEVIGNDAITSRLREYTLRTASLPEETHVRVLLPEDYGSTQADYPVIYLFHGGTEDWTAWTTDGDAVTPTAGLDVIVVMPDAGPFGFGAAFYNEGAFGPPLWETYHVEELVPFIDATYRTVADRSGRGIAGLSLGGHVAFSYAARHPDLFGVAGSFSGSVDTNTERVRTILQPVTPLIYGAREEQEIRWRGDNTYDLAPNLQEVNLSMYVGQGLGDGSPADLEPMVHEMAVNLHRRLEELGIEHQFDDYGPGAHSFEYFQRSFERWLPDAMAYFAKRTTDVPRSFTYISTRDSYGVWGWRFQITREALEFSSLAVRDASTFEIIGSGEASVTTSAIYVPGRSYTVTTTGSAGTTNAVEVSADEVGRLQITVPLGPANRQQQLTAPANPPVDGAVPVTDLPFFAVDGGSNFFRTTVTITSS